MEYLKIWTSFRESLEPFTDAERGRLFMAMLEYAELGTEPCLSGNERYLWPTARQSIDNTRERSEQMKANASKAKQTEAKPSKPKQTEAKPSSLFDKEKEKEKDKVKDKDIKSANALSANAKDDGRLFDKFWSVYPRHEGKQSAVKAFNKAHPDEQLLETMINAILKQKQTEQWSDPRYIPHPATWLNGKRWEDEPTNGGGGKRVLAQQYEQRDYQEDTMRELLGTDDLYSMSQEEFDKRYGT